TNIPTVTFGFSGTDNSGTGLNHFEVSLDGGPFLTDTSPKTYVGLPDGLHTFEVRAVDNAITTDPTPATRSFTVDTIAPATILTAGPSGTINSSAATFSFLGVDGTGSGVVGFQVRLDGGTFTSASSPQTYVGLAEGLHSFDVRAIDAAGNQSTSL